MEETDLIIIGAGVVGLAVAAELSARFPGQSIIVLEQNEKFGLETSSRNSEVIHAGIYYPAGSLKARLCVQGKRRLYQFCEDRAVDYRRLGKLIVATDETDLPALEDLLQKSINNDVEGMEILNRDQVHRLEPDIRAHAALYSPSTGVVNSYQLMERLEDMARQEGTLIAYRHCVTGLEPRKMGFAVHFHNPDGSTESLACRWLVNSAGLNADSVAAYAGIDIDAAGYRQSPCKGEYFSVPTQKAKKISHLIYPPPMEELKGLGIHVTKTLDNRLRLGPNAFYVDKIDYLVDPAHAVDFYESVKGFLPFLEPGDLEPEMAGIRPKLYSETGQFRDFIVRHEAQRGLPGLINLIGIESPGLTSCLALADMVADMVEDGDR